MIKMFNLKKSIIENYEGPESEVVAYQYLFELENPINVSDFNKNPVTILCEIDNKSYSFNLTTDLIDKILQSFSD